MVQVLVTALPLTTPATQSPQEEETEVVICRLGRLLHLLRARD